MSMRGIVFSGSTILSAGTVAVSIPIKDHITKVVTVANSATGCRSVGFTGGKISGCMLEKPNTIINIKGNIFRNVVTTWNVPLLSILRIFRPTTDHINARATKRLSTEDSVIDGKKTPRYPTKATAIPEAAAMQEIQYVQAIKNPAKLPSPA